MLCIEYMTASWVIELLNAHKANGHFGYTLPFLCKSLWETGMYTNSESLPSFVLQALPKHSEAMGTTIRMHHCQVVRTLVLSTKTVPRGIQSQRVNGFVWTLREAVTAAKEAEDTVIAVYGAAYMDAARRMKSRIYKSDWTWGDFTPDEAAAVKAWARPAKIKFLKRVAWEAAEKV